MDLVELANAYHQDIGKALLPKPRFTQGEGLSGFRSVPKRKASELKPSSSKDPFDFRPTAAQQTRARMAQARQRSATDRAFDFTGR